MECTLSQLKFVDSTIQIFHIFTDFLLNCFINDWEKSAGISKYSFVFVQFFLFYQFFFMYFEAQLASTWTLVVIMSSWSISSLIIVKCPFLSLVKFFAVAFALSKINIDTLAFFWLFL